MRKILFKGKLKNTGKWVRGDYFHDRYGRHCIRSLTNEVIPDTVCQFIGHTALEEQLVFENDILEDVESGKEYEVLWIEEESAFALKEAGYDDYSNTVDFLSEDGETLILKVVGNLCDPGRRKESNPSKKWSSSNAGYNPLEKAQVYMELEFLEHIKDAPNREAYCKNFEEAYDATRKRAEELSKAKENYFTEVLR